MNKNKNKIKNRKILKEILKLIPKIRESEKHECYLIKKQDETKIKIQIL